MKKWIAAVATKCLLLVRIQLLNTTTTTIFFACTCLGARGVSGTISDFYLSRNGPGVHEYISESGRFAGVCRVAVCLSGHIRSFVHPIVHMSIRRNLVEAMREDGCEVDVFAYASPGDTVASLKKHLNPEFTPDASDVDTALAYLAPVRVSWHQEQAGIIPNACPEEMDSHGNSTTADSDGAWWERYKSEASRNLFWQLYKSRAAYHMALEEETRRGGGFSYDWIIRARFDVAWVRPIPSVRQFPREAVYFHSHYWPMSDQFALVPRALSDRFFSAVAAFYACDGVSWPPSVSWWQPDCHGMSFEESVLFRHIHAAGVPYRLFSMFEYVIARGEGGGMCKLGSDYIHICNVLVGLPSGMLPRPPLDGPNCIITLAEWANLRCRALFSSRGEKDPRRMNAILDRNPASWETLIRSPFPSTEQTSATEPRTRSADSAHITDPPTIEEIDSIRSRMIALRDALMAPSSPALEDVSAFGSGGSIGGSGEERRKRDRWEGFEKTPSWWIFSPNGCPITEPQYPGRAPHLVMYYTVGKSLKREVAGALKCHINRLIGGDVDHTSCNITRPLEEVTIDVSLQTEELGVCTVDGSLGLGADDHAQRFFRDPTAHCVGYDRLVREDDQPLH